MATADIDAMRTEIAAQQEEVADFKIQVSESSMSEMRRAIDSLVGVQATILQDKSDAVDQRALMQNRVLAVQLMENNIEEQDNDRSGKANKELADMLEVTKEDLADQNAEAANNNIT